MQYTAATGYVTRVGGLATRSQQPEADDCPPGIQYTGGFGRVTAVGGRPTHRRQPTQRGSDHYWHERRRHELAAERRAHPDAAVHGCVVPYGVPLPDGRGDRLLFGVETRWLIGSPPVVPLQLEHGGSMLGVATVVEERSGLVIGDGTIYAAFRKAVGDRGHLSVGLGEYHCRQRADGMLEVTDAELREISLVRTARWPDHCEAHIWTKAG